MITYHYQDISGTIDTALYSAWLLRVAHSEGHSIDALNYIFCADAYLLTLNKTYLKHNTLTDVITFDYVSGTTICGDIFISLERVEENAATYQVSIAEEQRRVMVHGLLHLMGYKDKTAKDQLVMTSKEDEKIKLFHVEH